MSLRLRLFLAYALLLIVALAFFALLVSREERRWVVRRNVETLERLAHLAARDLPHESAATDPSTAARQLGRQVGLRVTLIDSTGVVLGDTDVPVERLSEVENHAGRPEVREALAGRSGHGIRHSHTIGLDLLYVAIPTRTGDVAVLRLAEPLTVIARLNASLLGLTVVAGMITLLIGLVAAYWVAGRHAARVAELEIVAGQLGAGLPARARERPADEVGRLGRALNQMSVELRRRLEALERERDERERILAHLSDGVALLDATGHVVHMNHAMAFLLGVPRPATPGTAFQESARAPELDALVQQVRREGRTLEAELRLWTPRQHLVRATATPLAVGPGGGVLLVLHDLSEAERVNRVRQDFVANVSHELRTPLTSLRGYADTLLSGGLDDVEHRGEFVQIIHDQAVRLQALVDDLLSLAELERPDTRLRLERFDLRELASTQARSFRDAAERGGLELVVEPGPPVPVTADRARVEQVLANLIDNAIQYTPRGQVRLRLGEDDPVAWCEVEDTGPGIPEEHQPRVFERFYRVDTMRSRRKGGTGLGLSIVKHIIALHNGAVVLRSAPGRGSTFRFELPRRPGDSA